jgi:hypothetical protein
MGVYRSWLIASIISHIHRGGSTSYHDASGTEALTLLDNSSLCCILLIGFEKLLV